MLDRLRRFRPVGTPGGAGPVGVPMDSRTGVPAELDPVFRALDAAIADSEEIRARASEQAARLIATARHNDLVALAQQAARASAVNKPEVLPYLQTTIDAYHSWWADLQPTLAIAWKRCRAHVGREGK